MKFGLSFFSIVILFICGFKPPATENFSVDTKKSSLEWAAYKVGGSHNGTVKLSSGTLLFEGSVLKSGNFSADMTTIAISDLSGTSNRNLLNHLKGEDFFSVQKYPMSKFEITEITPIATDRINIKGKLSIKGITNSITFPATIKRNKNTVIAVAKGIKVDRTKYDIKYRSKSFFGNVGDKAIDDEFELSINLVARK